MKATKPAEATGQTGSEQDLLLPDAGNNSGADSSEETGERLCSRLGRQIRSSMGNACAAIPACVKSACEKVSAYWSDPPVVVSLEEQADSDDHAQYVLDGANVGCASTALSTIRESERRRHALWWSELLAEIIYPISTVFMILSAFPDSPGGSHESQGFFAFTITVLFWNVIFDMPRVMLKLVDWIKDAKESDCPYYSWALLALQAIHFIVILPVFTGIAYVKACKSMDTLGWSDHIMSSLVTLGDNAASANSDYAFGVGALLTTLKSLYDAAILRNSESSEHSKHSENLKNFYLKLIDSSGDLFGSAGAFVAGKSMCAATQEQGHHLVGASAALFSVSSAIKTGRLGHRYYMHRKTAQAETALTQRQTEDQRPDTDNEEGQVVVEVREEEGAVPPNTMCA